jgi:hypothetical protein
MFESLTGQFVDLTNERKAYMNTLKEFKPLVTKPNKFEELTVPVVMDLVEKEEIPLTHETMKMLCDQAKARMQMQTLNRLYGNEIKRLRGQL